jgi:hypothetical protein
MDDLSFGSDVWGTTSDAIPPPPSSIPTFPTNSSTDDGFDDFDDFGGSEATKTVADAVGDDFGDFGDFGEPQMGISSGYEAGQSFEEDIPIAGPSIPTADWEPLRLHPPPSKDDIRRQVEALIAPLWADENIAGSMTDDDIRQVEGLKQILVTSERYFPPHCTRQGFHTESQTCLAGLSTTYYSHNPRQRSR